MARKNEAHEMVIESLSEALLKLMGEKPLSEIRISELCSRAGVSRISFYRNFHSMQDILIQYLSKCTDDWWNEFSKKPPEEFSSSFWPELSGQYKKNDRLIKLLYQNNASHILKEHIFGCCGVQQEHDEREAYTRAVLAGAIYGLVDEWIKRGMEELPKDFSLYSIAAAMPKIMRDEL